MTERKRVSLREAATLLSLTESGVRARFRKGELVGERDNTGKIWVFIEPTLQGAVQPVKHPHRNSESGAMQEVLAVLKVQLAAVTAERDTYRTASDERTRAVAEIAGLQQQVAMLESERDDLRRRLDAEGEERRKLFDLLTNETARPWWRKLFG